MKFTPDKVYDIAIVGAGPVGITLALLLSKLSLKVCVISRQDCTHPPKKDGRNFALMRGSWKVLNDAGVAKNLQANAQPIEGLMAKNGVDKIPLPFFSDEIIIGQDDLNAVENHSPFGYMVSADKLNHTLSDAIATCEGIDIVQGEVAGCQFETTRRYINLVDGSQIAARLVCACDGVSSAVREALSIGLETRDYKTTVFNFDATLTRPHGSLAQQIFTPMGPCALLPLQGDRANFAWYVPSKSAGFLKSLTTDALQAEFNTHHNAHFGPITIFSETPISYPLKMQIAQDIIAPRAALLGTAARHVNPMVGQGLNIGLKDVAALLDTIKRAQAIGSDLGATATLKGYKAARWGDGTAWALGIDSLERIFATNIPGAGLVRRLGMSGVANTPWLKRFFAENAIGAKKTN